MKTRSSEELMVLYQQDVPGTFDELYRRHRGKVEALCVRLVTRFHKELLPHIADIVQDVFRTSTVTKSGLSAAVALETSFSP